ncbi:hypothetical protein DOY81_000648 [Sarcophaga bullata]|nr:hypothetical protein DOY81_000648 [Sarcophaga bullata]
MKREWNHFRHPHAHDITRFLARKKFSQITFLHVYHHSTMIVGVCIYVTFLYASHFLYIGIINGFVHVIMYGYYFLAASKLNINLERFKRILTLMQLLQFVLVAIHSAIPLFINECNIPKILFFLTLLQSLCMIALFSHFYYKAYILKDRERQNTSAAVKVQSAMSDRQSRKGVDRCKRQVKQNRRSIVQLNLGSQNNIVKVFGKMLLLRLIYRQLVAINKSFEGDKRFSPYPFTRNLWLVLAITILYALTALKWGPKFMAKRFLFGAQKFNQITFLHVYHHTLMILASYLISHLCLVRNYS